MYNHEIQLIDYFLAIHQIISRGVNVSLDRIDGFIQNGFAEDVNQKGYFDFIHALTLMLDAHHKIEDDIAFPHFRDALQNTHFEWLKQDHDWITGFLEELAPVVVSLKSDPSVHNDLNLLKEILEKIEDRWSQHIELEEEEFIELIDDLSTPEEKSQLLAQFAEYNHGLLIPHEITLPFMLYNLEPQGRLIIEKTHPAEWFNDLNSPDWVEKWQSMKPFFLRED